MGTANKKECNLEAKPFGVIRNFLWPIYNHELPRLLPMVLLFFLIMFIYNLMRNLKITLIVNAEGSNASIIPILKVGVVIPGAILMTYLFTKLANKLQRDTMFYIVLAFFLGYYMFFLLVLYPNHKHLQLDFIANYLQSTILASPGCQGLVSAIRHLNLTFFYVMVEMWSTVVLFMLFWGFANEVTKVNEAKRFYAIFALGANCSGMFVGMFATAIQKYMPYVSWLPFDASSQWIFHQMVFVCILGLIIIGIFYWLNNTVFLAENLESKAYTKLRIKDKSKQISLMSALKYLFQSRYLFCVTAIVVSYNIVYNLSDVLWTSKLKELYPATIDFNAYMSQVTFWTGTIAVVLAFFVSGNVIRCYGWTVAALITPVIWIVTGLGFYLCMFLDAKPDLLPAVVANLFNPANLALLVGSVQISLGRACKYTVFDETKEIAFIPLAAENQRRGKAVVDGIASRLGKSGGSVIYLFLIFIFGTEKQAIIYFAILAFLIMAVWLYSVVNLGSMVKKSIDNNTDEHSTAVNNTDKHNTAVNNIAVNNSIS